MIEKYIFQVNSNFSMTAIDDFVTRDMVAEMLNILGVHIPNSSPNISEQPDTNTFDHRLYSRQLSEQEQDKLGRWSSGEIRRGNLLASLTGCDVRTIARAEEELSQAKHWDRLCPAPDLTLPSPSYYDELLAVWEQRYAEDRQAGRSLLTELCNQKWHLQVPEKQ